MTTMKRALRLCEARAKLREWQDMDIVRVGEDERRIQFTADQLAFHRKWGGGIEADYST